MAKGKWMFKMMVGATPDHNGRCVNTIYTRAEDFPHELVEQLGYDVIDVDEDKKIVYMDIGDE